MSKSRSDYSSLNRLLTEAVSDYIHHPRPTRDDADKLDRMAVPMVPHVSEQTLRLASATLASCKVHPHQLTTALLKQDIKIAAPLIASLKAFDRKVVEFWVSQSMDAHLEAALKSPILTETTRTRLMTALNTIKPEADITAIQARKISDQQPEPEPKKPRTQDEILQDGLRKIMLRNALPGADLADDELLKKLPKDTLIAKVINASLRDDRAGVAQLLARELRISRRYVERSLQKVDYRALNVLLKAAGFGASDAYAVASLFYTIIYKTRETIALYYVRFHAISEAEIENVLMLETVESISPATNRKIA